MLMTSPMPLPDLNLHLYVGTARAPLEMNRSSAARPTLALCPTDIACMPFAISFEQAVEQLERLERMFIEPDGSFVWTGNGPASTWQLEGMLYDAGGFVQRVELKGCCPLPAWHELLRCLAPSKEFLIAQLLDSQCLVPVPALEQLWESSDV